MALKEIHTTTAYQDVRNEHIKKSENEPLSNDILTNLDAHFEGTSMAFGYGYDLFQNITTLQTDLSTFVSYKASSTSVSAALQSVYDLILANSHKVGKKRVFKASSVYRDAKSLATQINTFITLTNGNNAELSLRHKSYLKLCLLVRMAGKCLK
ncbi:MAG: hypothetical protein GY928_30900 [Colwellia sp.]|nr:hypothetical protein [Colwellia sp.]